MFSEAEIKVFFEECDRFVLRYKANGRPYTLPALYRFLYCCGVRCREARNLKCSEVHLDEGYVDILQSKAHRDRRLYLSDELIDYSNYYIHLIPDFFPKYAQLTVSTEELIPEVEIYEV